VVKKLTISRIEELCAQKGVKITHQKLKDQNKIDKEFKLLVEKRVKLTHKKLVQQKISQ